MRKTFTLSIPEALATELEKASKAQGVTRSQFVQQMLWRKFLNGEFKSIRSRSVGDLLEDEQDIRDFKKREREKTVDFDEVLRGAKVKRVRKESSKKRVRF